MSSVPTGNAGRRRPAMMFEWDYGYELPFRGWNNLEARLTADLIAELRSWVDEFDRTPPGSRDNLPTFTAWLAKGRRLRDRVAAEMGPDVDVFFPTSREEIIAAFQAWLTAQGWKLVGDPVSGLIRAQRPDGATLVAVAGEHSASQRQTVDHLYGRLLRAFNPTQENCRHAIVVPQSLIGRCLEVPADVRKRLGIDLYSVAEDSSVNLIAQTS